MKFVLIFGPQAVGKMTVGHELEKITGLKLFHNHMTIELAAPFFDYGTSEGRQLVTVLREAIFKAVSKSDLTGLIFTYLWDFDSQEEWDYINHICDIFEQEGAEIYFVELEADFEERLKRNKTSHRLKHKPTKRDVEKSEAYLRNGMKNYRTNSNLGEIKRKNYMRIDNAKLNPLKVAQMIVKKFKI